MSLSDFDRPYYARYVTFAGVDEAGRGPLAGPVVAAAVVLPPSLLIPGLNDSKKLSHARRVALLEIIQNNALAIGIGQADSSEIDRVNIFQSTVLAMRRALAQLAGPPPFALVDGRRLKALDFPHEGVVGGDGKSASIAAASIVAKVTRDRLMESFDDKYPGYGFRQHKGYGTVMHLANLKRLGPTPIHRRSFAPLKNSFE